MHRRGFLGVLAVSSVALALPGCARVGGGAAGEGGMVMTVGGPIDAADLGMTLTHEHLFADLRPHAEQVARPLPLDMDEVVVVVLPHLREIRRLGCRTLIDCTATTLGRNPALIKRLSAASGLHMLTVTGAYAAAGGRFVPPYVRDETSDQLAARWIGEWRHGIGDTGVRPGLIKLGVEGDPLSDTERKLLRAAARTHLESGLVIASHTGPWSEVEPGRNARCAFAQLELLEAAGVAPSAWIWVHAQNEAQVSHHVQAARRGAWVSFDGFRPGQAQAYVASIGRMREEGLLHRVLVSQDAGWYHAGEPRGGEFNPFHPVFTSLIPALRGNGFGEDEIQTIFVRNPARAFAVRAGERRDS
jgi:phosphotriesterase-related protein